MQATAPASRMSAKNSASRATMLAMFTNARIRQNMMLIARTITIAVVGAWLRSDTRADVHRQQPVERQREHTRVVQARTRC